MTRATKLELIRAIEIYRTIWTESPIPEIAQIEMRLFQLELMESLLCLPSID